MPKIKQIKSLQNLCLENVAQNVDKWFEFDAETVGEGKVHHLGAANGPFHQFRK